jgi:hypothetical protein
MNEEKERLIRELMPKVEEYCSLARKLGEVWADIAKLTIGNVLTARELEDNVYRIVFAKYDQTHEIRRGCDLLAPLRAIVDLIQTQEK